jgi:integrase
MAGTVKHAKIENRTARARMKRGRQAHWRALVLGRVHLGYQRWPDEAAGRWILRRYIDGKYVVATLGLADDSESANGDRVLSFERAEAQARAALDRPANAHGRLTVRGAVTNYVEFQCAQGKPTGDLLSRSTAHILPPLGDAVVADLTSARLRNWLATLAGMPAMKRSRAGAPQQYKAEPEDDEAIRRRRASANRVLTMLKAALNHAYDEQLVSSNEAWGRRLKPFRDVETARIRYLTIAEAKRLLNACDREFRPLVQAALESGCRYSELTRLQVQDFNVDAGTLNIRRSKTGKSRHVVLSEEGTAFFRQTTLGRPGDALMFVRTDGTPLARFASGSARTNRGYVNRPRLAHRCRIRQLLRSSSCAQTAPVGVTARVGK